MTTGTSVQKTYISGYFVFTDISATEANYKYNMDWSILGRNTTLLWNMSSNKEADKVIFSFGRSLCLRWYVYTSILKILGYRLFVYIVCMSIKSYAETLL